MRLTELLSEAIVNPPRHLPLWTKNRIREFDGLIRQGEAMAALFEKADQDRYAVSDIGYRLERHFDDVPDFYRVTEAVNWFVRVAVKELHLNELRDNLDSVGQFGFKFVQYLLSQVGYIDWPRLRLDQIEILLARRDEIEPVLAEAGMLSDEPDPYFESIRHWLDMVALLADFLPRARAEIRHVQEKAQAMVDRRADAWQIEYHGSRSRIERHGDTEVLYHATAWADDIVASGFAAEPPEDRRGLGGSTGGGFGKPRLISFTHDLHVARVIARCLRELILIGRGDLKARHILEWLRSEDLPREPQVIRNHVGVWPQEITTPDKVAKLYEWYLWQTKRRSNPVFMDIGASLPRLQGRTERDVGIVACDVDLTRSEEYMFAEAEYRVPSDAVRNPRRIH